MQITSVQFVLFVLLAIIAWHLFAAQTYRRIVLLVANTIFLLTCASFNLLQVIPLLVFLSVGYLAIWLIRRHPNRYLLTLLVVAILGTFIYIRRYGFLQGVPALPFVYTVVG